MASWLTTCVLASFAVAEKSMHGKQDIRICDLEEDTMCQALWLDAHL